MSDSLWPLEPQNPRPPCPSPTPGVHPNPCPSSQWCHPTISSSVIPFFSCPQSFPASGTFQMSQLFVSGVQTIEASASTSVLPMNTQDWSPLGWTGWISLQSKGLSRVFSNTTVQKHQFFSTHLECILQYHTCLSAKHPHLQFRENPWNSPGPNTGMGSLSLLQGVFPTQGSNPVLPHCRRILHQLSHKGSPRILELVAYPFFRGSSWPRNRTRVSCITGRFFTTWAIWEALFREQQDSN